MKILLLGKNGQVGWELQRSLAPLGEVIALDRQGADSLCGDLNDLSGLELTLRKVKPNIIVNAAAYTAVDKAEEEQALAECINAQAPALIAQEAKKLDALLVHYSTDYVFDGSGTAPRDETAPTAPLSVYGKTKLQGEQAIAAAGCRYLIFRTSWVYAARGNNFAKTMLRLAQEREGLTVIDDQQGAPTGADLIADVTVLTLQQVAHKEEFLGIYNLVASGETSWHAYAQFVIEQAKFLRPDLPWQVNEIAPVPTAAFPTPAQRPLNSRLTTTKLETNFGLTLPPWQQGVARMLNEIL